MSNLRKAVIQRVLLPKEVRPQGPGHSYPQPLSSLAATASGKGETIQQYSDFFAGKVRKGGAKKGSAEVLACAQASWYLADSKVYHRRPCPTPDDMMLKIRESVGLVSRVLCSAHWPEPGVYLPRVYVVVLGDTSLPVCVCACVRVCARVCTCVWVCGWACVYSICHM